MFRGSGLGLRGLGFREPQTRECIRSLPTKVLIFLLYSFPPPGVPCLGSPFTVFCDYVLSSNSSGVSQDGLNPRSYNKPSRLGIGRHLR